MAEKERTKLKHYCEVMSIMGQVLCPELKEILRKVHMDRLMDLRTEIERSMKEISDSRALLAYSDQKFQEVFKEVQEALITHGKQYQG